MLPVTLWLLGCGSPDPYGLLVVTAGGIDPVQDADLAETFADRIEPFGFEVTVHPAALGTDDVLGEARSAAKSAGAAHAVVLELSSARERDGVLPNTALYQAQLTTHVVHVDPERPSASATIEHVREAESAAKVQDWARHTWTNAMAPWSVSRLYDTPEIEKAASGDVEIDQLAVATAVEENGKKVFLRTEREKDFRAYCADQRQRMENFDDRAGVTCVGDPCGQQTVLGVDAQGRAIVQDISRSPVFKIPPSTRKRAWVEAPETVTAVPIDDPDTATPLMRSANLYGFAHVSPGADAGVVETFSTEGTTAIVAFTLADGTHTAVAHLAKGEESSFDRASPDGSGLFFCLQTGDCWFEREGHSRKPQRSFRVAEWLTLPEGPRVVGQLREGGLAVDDPTAEEQPDPIPFEHRITRVLGVVDGTIQLMARDVYGVCGLVRVDPSTGAVREMLPLPTCIHNPSLAPDGRIIGTARAVSPGDIPGDDEVVSWDPGADDVVPLTSGPFREEYAYPTRDGQRVVFSRRLEAPPEQFDTELYRRVVCVTDLP